MTSSTKPEAHNTSHCRQKRTEPQSQITRTEHLVKFGHLFFEIREQTDKQTDMLITILLTHTGGGGEVKNGGHHW